MTSPLVNLQREILKARGRDSMCPLKAKAEQIGLFPVCRGAHVGCTHPRAIQGRGALHTRWGESEKLTVAGQSKRHFHNNKTPKEMVTNDGQLFKQGKSNGKDRRERGRGKGRRKTSPNCSFSSAPLEGQTSLKIYANLY